MKKLVLAMLALPTLFISISALAFDGNTPLNPVVVEKGKYHLFYHAYENDIVGYYYKANKYDESYKIGCGDPEVKADVGERKYVMDLDGGFHSERQSSLDAGYVQFENLASAIKHCRISH